MTEETKKQAKVKLDAIRNKIGYPDVWRDYSSLKVVRGDLLGNFQRANEFEARRQIAKIGKPLDRNEWGMTPPTVNAYYNRHGMKLCFLRAFCRRRFLTSRLTTRRISAVSGW